MATTTIYVTVGDADAAMSQLDWTHFVEAVQDELDDGADDVSGPWFTAPMSVRRSACWNFAIEESDIDALKAELRRVAGEHRQTAIAWTEMAAYEFLRPEVS